MAAIFSTSQQMSERRVTRCVDRQTVAIIRFIRSPCSYFGNGAILALVTASRQDQDDDRFSRVNVSCNIQEEKRSKEIESSHMFSDEQHAEAKMELCLFLS